MASFTLDDIRAAAEAKYGSTDVDLGDGRVMVLTNPLRLPKERRDALTVKQKQGEDDGADQGDVMRDALRIVTSTPANAERFIEIAGEDLAMLATVFASYTEGSQVGEA